MNNGSIINLTIPSLGGVLPTQELQPTNENNNGIIKNNSMMDNNTSVPSNESIYVSADQFNHHVHKPTDASINIVNPNSIRNMETIKSIIDQVSQPRPPNVPKNGKHLILDLDETLVKTFDREDDIDQIPMTPEQQKRRYVLEFPDGGVYKGYIRPYAEIFIKVCFDEFESVSVWSAGVKSYVEKLVDILFKGYTLKFVMNRDHCNELKTGKDDIIIRYKPLENVFAAYPELNFSNTYIIDDREEICSLNCMNNLAIVPFMMNSYNFAVTSQDITLIILARWLRTNILRNAKDIRTIKGKSPFKINPGNYIPQREDF